MLEKPEERVRLLRAGYTGKRIEQLYIEHNNFKIVRIPAAIEMIELDIPQDKKICASHEIAVEYA
ncbi:MAG: hypothetical protein OIN66_06580 [Candidatus Methanoperedens sp.]|nr:hypothetical protein [Candidatus Methanoperedens sp.]